MAKTHHEIATYDAEHEAVLGVMERRIYGGGAIPPTSEADVSRMPGYQPIGCYITSNGSSMIYDVVKDIERLFDGYGYFKGHLMEVDGD